MRTFTSCGKEVADTYTGVCRACLIDHYDDDGEFDPEPRNIDGEAR